MINFHLHPLLFVILSHCLVPIVTETKHSCAYVKVTNLFLMVDIRLCSNQTFHYWKMPFLTSQIQGCYTILKIENIVVILTQHSSTHTLHYSWDKCLNIQ